MDGREPVGTSRGDAGDILPWLPTPFTRSLFETAWPHAVSHLRARLGKTFNAPIWRWIEGCPYSRAAFWQEMKDRLMYPGPKAAHVLGLRPDIWPARPRRKGRWPGFLRRRSDDAWHAYEESVEASLRQNRRWTRQVSEVRWTQADLLQVMEEIAPQVGELLSAWVVTTLALADAVAATDTDDMTLRVRVQNIPLPLTHLLEDTALLNRRLTADSTMKAWLLHPEGTWPTPLTTFLDAYPWLSVQPFEAAAPRWHEVPSPLVAHLAERTHRNLPVRSVRHQTGQATEPVGHWLMIRERVRVALAQAVSAARVWVLAAAGEARSDGRLTTSESAFFLTLEELKQMMTGEWNRAEQVQPHVERRKSSFSAQGGKVPAAIPVPTPGTRVAVPGWQPGWVLAAAGAGALVTKNPSPLSYGHLLAAVLDIPIQGGIL